jgi:hypothetical protein
MEAAPSLIRPHPCPLERVAVRVVKAFFSVVVCIMALIVSGLPASAAPAPGKADHSIQYVPPACDVTCQANGTHDAMNWAATKYGFPLWFIYATVHRESTFRPGVTNGSGTGNCDIGYGLTQLTCRSHTGVVYPENLPAPDQSHMQWQWDMRIPGFCTETGLCPYIDMRNVTPLQPGEWADPYKNLDRYFSGYGAPAYYLERARAPRTPGESDAAYDNRILRRVAYHWRYGYGGPVYPDDPGQYFSGSTYPYNWDTYVSTYRPAVESEDGVWDGNVCRPPYSDTGCGMAPAPDPTYTSTTSVTKPCVVVGETTSITTQFTNTNGTAYDGRVAIQLWDARTPPVVATGDALRTIPANGSTTFSLDYTPQSVASAWKAYDIGSGVFAPNAQWYPNPYWAWAPQQVTVSADNRPYNFECGRVQGWTFNPGGLVGSIASSTARAYAGRSSLAVNLSGNAGTWGVRSDVNPKPGPGRTVQFRVFVPAGNAISAVQAFVKEDASGNWRWTGNYKPISQLTVGAWNLIPVTVPADAQPLDSLGVEFTTNATWAGTAHVDAIEWS